MAQMIPEFYPDGTPPGEKLFFDWVAKECPSDWIAFHSLDLQAWNRSKKTEIDFLILIPETGILCVEIKSHQKVEVLRGSWYLNGSPHTKSPLKQAEDAQKTFYRRLRAESSSFARIPSCRLVCFPSALVDFQSSIEHNHWEVWNMDDCISSVANKTFASKLVKALEASIKHDKYLKNLDRPISVSDAKKLEQFLRPTFKSAPASIAESRQRQLRMDTYLRAQQKPVLKLFADNGKVIIDGPAGTGKSLIAVEVARQAKDDGNRVGLFCFNNPMAYKIKVEIEDDAPLLIGGGVYSFIASMLDISIPENPDTNYWEHEFLETAEEILLNDELKSECQFDVLVLDEAQDLLARPRLLDIIECLLVGGFSNGQWLAAGDFNYQIFASDSRRSLANERLESLRNIPRTSYYQLDENCRNYRMVGDPALKLAGMTTGKVYSGFMRGDGNHTFFNPKFYGKEKGQSEVLKDEIRRYINNGTEMNGITILSFRKPDKSVAHELVGGDLPMKRIGQPGRGVSYGSIHEFKGLESSVIILTDVQQPTDQFEKDLFYVGVTRALYSVSILVPQSHQNWFLNAIGGKTNA